MAEADSLPPSSREIAAEDFLFHLYRGSELLQENRVHEAKQELEQALGLQPRDPKGQDLLAIVYFRLGMYPRAISIYRELIAAHPDATTPLVNLALCYLKTGQPAAARAELEKVIQRDPEHARAWGYLGLAFQRMNDVERAVAAFRAGGHHAMARRLSEASAPPAAPAGPTRSLTPRERAAVTSAMSAAFDEIDRRDFQADAGSSERATPAGSWAAVEPGREVLDRRSSGAFGSLTPSISPRPSDSLPPPSLVGAAPVLSGPSLAPASVRPGSDSAPGTSQLPRPPLSITEVPSFTRPVREAIPPPTVPPPAWSPPRPLEQLARDAMLVFPRDHAVALHTSGAVLVRTQTGLALRFDAVRALSTGRATAQTRIVSRRRGGAPVDEPFGGTASPLLFVDGPVQAVLGAPPGAKLVAIDLADGGICLREQNVIALVGDVSAENGKMPGADGDPVPVAALRGAGAVVCALPPSFVTVETAVDRELVLRTHAVLGWIGKVQIRALPPSDAPARARGLLAAHGEGTVLLDGR